MGAGICNKRFGVFSKLSWFEKLMTCTSELAAGQILCLCR